jgi:hypothetical protein
VILPPLVFPGYRDDHDEHQRRGVRVPDLLRLLRLAPGGKKIENFFDGKK